MRKLLEYLLLNIVQNPKDLKIIEKEKDGLWEFLIKAHQDDIKIIIGKKGQTIRAIRTVVKAKAIKEGKGVMIKISEAS